MALSTTPKKVMIAVMPPLVCVVLLPWVGPSGVATCVSVLAVVPDDTPPPVEPFHPELPDDDDDDEEEEEPDDELEPPPCR